MDDVQLPQRQVNVCITQSSTSGYSFFLILQENIWWKKSKREMTLSLHLYGTEARKLYQVNDALRGKRRFLEVWQWAKYNVFNSRFVGFVDQSLILDNLDDFASR